MFRIKALSDRAIWALGRRWVAGTRGKPLYGRADLSPEDVLAIGLQVKPDGCPPRHACIIGWPVDDNGKSLARLHEMQLAAKAVLKLVP